jgi:hypothetical protein
LANGAAKRAVLGGGLCLFAGALVVLAPIANGIFPSKDAGIVYVLVILASAGAGVIVLVFARIAFVLEARQRTKAPPA